MAIVVKGSGEITGISTGGLPDGSVDEDTLAANSVTAAKIVDGTIVDAEVTSLAASKLTGTIADARFPATLPAKSAANLTNIPAANITGTLPAISGANLTGIAATVAALTDATVSTSDPVITSNPSAVGHYWINSSSGETFVCTDATNNLNKWRTNGDGIIIEPFDPWYGARGIIAFGMTDSAVAINNIDYITIATTGNSTDFGDMNNEKRDGATTSNSTRGVMAGGWNWQEDATTVKIDYITIASTGNASVFGNLDTAMNSFASATDATTAIFTKSGVMQKITIASTGNAVSAGTVPESRSMVSGANNAVRGIVSAGGYQYFNEIYYVTWASLGNATQFGNISGRYATGSFESKTRAIFGGGYTSGRSNVMDYITVATLGNASDFGDIHTAAEGLGGLTSGTRGVFTPGQEPGRVNRLQYVTIDTLGNTTDFGDLSSVRSHSHGMSGD